MAERILHDLQKCIDDSTISTTELEKGSSYSAPYQALPYYHQSLSYLSQNSGDAEEMSNNYAAESYDFFLYSPCNKHNRSCCTHYQNGNQSQEVRYFSIGPALQYFLVVCNLYNSNKNRHRNNSIYNGCIY